MADVTGRFDADFGPFEEAVRQAEDKMKSFESGGARVATQLGKMGDSFSGVRVIQDATLMVEAIERIGGASKLTEKELARASATAAEAAAKMKALGQDVPPGLQKIADETKQVDTATGSLTSTVKGLAAGLVAMFSARAAFSFAKDILDGASALADLSQQTHINVEDLQRLTGAMSEFGVTQEEVGKGLFTLSRKIAGGDDSVARALHTMGLSLADVRGQNGQELFLTIEHGLAQLQGGLRDTTAAELYGSKLGAAMAGAAEGIDGALSAWTELNDVMSQESVAALDAYGEAIARTQKSLSAMAANMIGPVAEGFNVLFNTAQRGASKWELLAGLLPKGFAGIGTGVEGLTAIIDAQNQKLEANAAAAKSAAAGHQAMTVALTEEQQRAQFMAALERDAAVALEASQVKNLEHLKEIGALNAANAEKIGVSGAQFAKYTADIEAAKTAAKELAAAQKEADAQAITSLNNHITELQRMEAARLKSYGTVEQLAMLGRLDEAEQALTRAVYGEIDSERARMKVVEEAGARHTAITLEKQRLEAALTQQIATALLAEQEAKTKINAAYGLNALGVQAQTGALAELDQKLHDLQATAAAGEDTTARQNALYLEATTRLQQEAMAVDQLGQAQGAVTAGAKDLKPAADGAAAGIDRVGASAQQASGGLLSMQAELYNAIRAAQLMDEQSDRFGHYIGPSIPGYSPPGRAGGGPVTGGSPYLVGEQGPELFVPRQSGTIVPNGGGGMSVVVNVQGSVLSSRQALADAVGEALIGQLRREGSRLG